MLAYFSYFGAGSARRTTTGTHQDAEWALNTFRFQHPFTGQYHSDGCINVHGTLWSAIDHGRGAGDRQRRSSHEQDGQSCRRFWPASRALNAPGNAGKREAPALTAP